MTILLPKLRTLIQEFLSTYLALRQSLVTSGANNRKLLFNIFCIHKHVSTAKSLQ